jgi:hypothetical protein
MLLTAPRFNSTIVVVRDVIPGGTKGAVSTHIFSCVLATGAKTCGEDPGLAFQQPVSLTTRGRSLSACGTAIGQS